VRVLEKEVVALEKGVPGSRWSVWWKPWSAVPSSKECVFEKGVLALEKGVTRISMERVGG